MTKTHEGALIRIGLLIHGNKIWMSEFVSIFLVGLVLAVLFGLTLTIVIDEAVIHHNDGKISALQNDSISIAKNISDYSQKATIVDALTSFRGSCISRQTNTQLAELVFASSSTYGYDPYLLLAVITVESKFIPQAKGQYRSGEFSGAFGLMQIKLETAQEIGKNLGLTVRNVGDLYKPEVNLAVGVAYLTRLIAQFHSFKLGLLAYNQGPGVIREYLNTQTPLSIDYYNKVLKNYYLLKKASAQINK